MYVLLYHYLERHRLNTWPSPEMTAFPLCVLSRLGKQRATLYGSMRLGKLSQGWSPAESPLTLSLVKIHPTSWQAESGACASLPTSTLEFCPTPVLPLFLRVGHPPGCLGLSWAFWSG